MQRVNRLALAIVCICMYPATYAQNPIFPESELFATGVYYYPEHWPQEQWERDLKNIADLGFEFTHIIPAAGVSVWTE